MPGSFRVEVTDAQQTILCSGDWTMATARFLSSRLHREPLIAAKVVVLDLGAVKAMDTAGAWLLHRTADELRQSGATLEWQHVSPRHHQLLATLVDAAPAPGMHSRPQRLSMLTPLADIGRAAEAIASRFAVLLAFLGAVMVASVRQLLRPRTIRWNAITHQFEHVGYHALPIIGLLSFLIGAVLVQQGAYQLKQFGAEVFVVDLVSIATLRELGVLICAILVAGRSGSAFTAQIGSMKLQEEIDAMDTIGLDPVQVLVLPRVLCLILLMPLLGFYSSIMSLTGGALFSYLQLGIPVATFLERMQETVTLDTFLVGMIKAPIFGLVIAVVGCFEGLQVEGSAQSLGERTTMSVVISIFMVIVIDAFMAIFFTTIGM